MTTLHPITGERLYSLEEFDTATHQHIEAQCDILEKHLQKRKTHKNTPTAYA